MSRQLRAITVLGCGSWGTALANHLCRLGHSVTLWGREKEVLAAIASERRNIRYFPDDVLAAGLQTRDSITDSVSATEILVVAVPSFAVRGIAGPVAKVLPKGAAIVSATKGLEDSSLKTMTEIWQDELGSKEALTVLAGPSFAAEVLRGMPTAVTVAGYNPKTTEMVVQAFHAEQFRVYSSADVVGAEIGGAAKNVIALATGMLEGVGLGANARAALITRGLAEIQRLVVACGGQTQTVIGLSGLGDLFLTCTGDLSRNRRVGLMLGKGEKLSDILAKLGQVAEGVETTPKLLRLAERHKVETPIIREVAGVIRGDTSVDVSISRLLSRAPARE